jgi:hypothetical protein
VSRWYRIGVFDTVHECAAERERLLAEIHDHVRLRRDESPLWKSFNAASLCNGGVRVHRLRRSKIADGVKRRPPPSLPPARHSTSFGCGSRPATATWSCARAWRPTPWTRS